MAKDELFKSVSFGGYDKVSVDMYIEDLKNEHIKDIEELKGNITRLSDTVKNLQAMRESNSNESKQTMDALSAEKNALNDEVVSLKARIQALEAEKVTLKEQAEQYKNEASSLSEKAASISTILVDTQLRADAMLKEAKQKSDGIVAKANEDAKALRDKTTAECADLKKKTEEERTRTKQFTEEECRKKLEKAEQEKNTIITQAKYEATTVRSQLKKECTGISSNMTELMEALQGVVKSCNSTKLISDKAVQGIYEATKNVPQQPQPTSQAAPQAPQGQPTPNVPR